MISFNLTALDTDCEILEFKEVSFENLDVAKLRLKQAMLSCLIDNYIATNFEKLVFQEFETGEESLPYELELQIYEIGEWCIGSVHAIQTV